MAHKYDYLVRFYLVPLKEYRDDIRIKTYNNFSILVWNASDLISSQFGVEKGEIVSFFQTCLQQSDKPTPIPEFDVFEPKNPEDEIHARNYGAFLWLYYTGVDLKNGNVDLEPPSDWNKGYVTEKNPEAEQLTATEEQQEDPEKEKEEEQKELDKDQKQLEKEIDNVTTELDKELPEPPEKEEEKTEKPNTLNKDLDDIRSSLENIQGSLSIQANDLQQINNNSSISIGHLTEIKNLFKAQKDIFDKNLEESKLKLSEASLEANAGKVASGSAESTSSLTKASEAEGVIEKIDGNNLVVKPTKGEFLEGQKITQTPEDGGLFGILKGIISKFPLGKKNSPVGNILPTSGGGEIPPIKLSSGGFLNTSYPAPMAKGGMIAPGVYNKPTRGNLAPGQAVIPLNRNVGKKVLSNQQSKELRKYDQPMVDAMSQPLRAAGMSVLVVAGDFIRSMGPLGGFFAPYLLDNLSSFSRILDIPSNIVTSLIGGPAAAATLDQKRQQNIFADIWNNLMNKLGISLGSPEEKIKREGGRKDNTSESFSGGAGDWGPLLEQIRKAEGGWESISGRKPIPGLTNWTIQKVATDAPSYAGAYQLDPDMVISWAKDVGLNPSDKFSPENQNKIAVGLIEGRAQGKQWRQRKISDQKFARNLATIWAGLPVLADTQGAKGPIRRGTSYYSGVSWNAANVKPEDIESAFKKISAESGTQVIGKDNKSLGKLLDIEIFKGPRNGYDVNDNLQLHGTEALLRYENGFTVLPIENNKYSLANKPNATLSRWKEISRMNPTDKTTFESGGSGKFDPALYSNKSFSTNYIIVNGKSYVVQYSHDRRSNEYVVKAITKKVTSGSWFGLQPDNLTSVKPNSAEGKQVVNSKELKNYFEQGGMKVKISVDKDADTYYNYNQSYQTTKNAWLRRGASQENAERYAAAAAKQFALTGKSNSVLPGGKGGLNASLKNVSVTSASDSTSSSSGESSSSTESQNPLEMIQNAIEKMMVGAGIMASQINNLEEYNKIKSDLESNFKMSNVQSKVEVQNETKTDPAVRQTISNQQRQQRRSSSSSLSNAGSTDISQETKVSVHTQLEELRILRFA